jgi:hypothetical protein
LNLGAENDDTIHLPICIGRGGSNSLRPVPLPKVTSLY